MKPIGEKERENVLGYLREQTEPLKNPARRIAEDVLLMDFGWPKSEGKQRALVIVKEFVAADLVQCVYGKGGRLYSVKFISPQPVTMEEAGIVAVEPEKPKGALQQKEQRSAPTTSPRKKFKVRKKGVVRRLKKALDRGDSNEQQVYLIVSGLLESIHAVLRDDVEVWRCRRSGSHRPEFGKIDRRDSDGEDVGGTLIIRGVGGQFIIQARSSPCGAAKFNSFIKICPGQENALFKKAFWFSRGKKLTVELAAEILDEFIAKGFSMLAPRKEEILRTFENRARVT